MTDPLAFAVIIFGCIAIIVLVFFMLYEPKPKIIICSTCGSKMIKFEPEIISGNTLLHRCPKCGNISYMRTK